LAAVPTPPAIGESFAVDCPHCGKSFEAELLGESERTLGFKCPHCRLFVAYQAAEEQSRVEPTR
jgi:phage FluMu protein Com